MTPQAVLAMGFSKKFILFNLFAIFWIISPAYSEGLSVPLKAIKKPAADLHTGNGVAIDPGVLGARAQQGEDLSFLDPIPNKMWQPQPQEADNSASNDYPIEGETVRFDSFEAATPFTYFARIESLENPGRYFRFSLSRYTHAVLLRGGLLRKLGYFIQSPKLYKNLTLQFDSLEQLEAAVAQAEESTTSDFADREWIKNINKEKFTVTFSLAMLEETSNEFFDIHWGLAPNPKNPNQLPLVQRLSRYRAYRALITPYVIADIPESINRFSAKVGSVLSDNLVLNHPSADSFAAADIADLKWLARRMARLSERDLDEIIETAQLPTSSLAQLVKTKLIYRINNFLELSGLKSLIQIQNPSLKITSSDGLVVDGKVTQERIKGSPLRFSHGERTSPYQEGDLARYLGISGRSTTLTRILSYFNEHLQAISVADVANDRAAAIREKVNNHIRTNPREPLYQKVEGWGGPVAGLNVSSSRSVSTGTYFESEAPVQLVDSVSIAGNVGYFYGLDGVQNVFPNGGGNVSIVRTYTHVRPIESLKEGTKVSWNDLYIPKFMDKLSQVLETENMISGKNPDDPKQYPLDQFLTTLKVGEVITISDTLAFGLYAQLSSPLDALLGIGPLNFLNSVSMGADSSLVTLRQTTITRTHEGLQIYLRKTNTTGKAINFDMSYFISMLNVRAQTTNSDGHTDAYILDYDPEWISQLDLTEPKNEKYGKLRNDLRVSLFSLLQDNDNELLSAKFKDKRFQVEHDLVTKASQTRILAWKSLNFKENHTVKILYPALARGGDSNSEEYPQLNPKDESITLFAHLRGELLGRDILGLALDTLGGILKKFAKIDAVSRDENPNPANIPLGRAYWRIVKTEADLSANAASGRAPMETVSTLQHVWGGWSLKKDKFINLLEEIRAQFESKELSYRLIEPEAFANVKKIDFYRITANLSLNPSGVKKLISLISGDSGGDVGNKPKTGKGIFAKIFGQLFGKLRGDKNYRSQDAIFFNDLLLLLGEGNKARGKAIYDQQCQEEKARNTGGETTISSGQWENGIFYECLSSWTNELLELSRNLPQDKKSEAIWVSKALFILDRNIPMKALFNYLGEENYVFLVKINGFRAGDEDGDLEYFSNTYGNPKKNLESANGLINYWATKTRISPIELDRSQGSFK